MIRFAILVICLITVIFILFYSIRKKQRENAEKYKKTYENRDREKVEDAKVKED